MFMRMRKRFDLRRFFSRWFCLLLVTPGIHFAPSADGFQSVSGQWKQKQYARAPRRKHVPQEDVARRCSRRRWCGDSGGGSIASFWKPSIPSSTMPFLSCRFMTTATSSSSSEKEFVAVDEEIEEKDIEAVLALFQKYCDSENQMSRERVVRIPAVAGLLKRIASDDLPDELRDLQELSPASTVRLRRQRINANTFVQLYQILTRFAVVTEKQEQKMRDKNDSRMDDSADAILSTPPIMTSELESIFVQLCDTKDNANKNIPLISKSAVQSWDEIQQLLNDKLLSLDDLESVWCQTRKSSPGADTLDMEGFLHFNQALDDLFDDDTDNVEDEDDESVQVHEPVIQDFIPKGGESSNIVAPEWVDGDGLSPTELFQNLAHHVNKPNLNKSQGMASGPSLHRSDVLRWKFIREAMDDGNLTESELDTHFNMAAKGLSVLNRKAFLEFYRAIDDLFEEEDDDDVDGDEEIEDANADMYAETDAAGTTMVKKKDVESQLIATHQLKSELFATLQDLQDPDLLPCGLDCTDREQKIILSLVSDLERQASNFIGARYGDIDVSDLNGSWDLLYSSSSAMRFHKGLSGLGGSVPNGKLGGVKQILRSSKFVTDVEYIERIEVIPSAASFDVTVTGDWDLRRSISLFTGEPSLVMTIVPDRISYGLTNMKADHWKSLGPMNMLDISYLDQDLRVMRGNTAIDTVFIFRRSSR